jgi:hypothetical protein
MPVFGVTPAIGAAVLGPSLAATAGTVGTTATGIASLAGTASGLAQTGMGIAGAVGGGGGGQQQSQVPAPQGNPMAQNAFASNGQQQQQLDMDPIGGLPGGGGWMG